MSDFVTAKVRLQQAKNQIFGAEFFPQGGGKYLIISGLKNVILLFFHSADNQQVTTTNFHISGNCYIPLIINHLQQ